MAEITFYEKSGCLGNHEQKTFLRKQGVKLQVRNLLTSFWTAETLRPFFRDEPVSEWFHLSSPRIKSGELDISSFSESDALDAMLADPILIRRPLLVYGELRQSGFVDGPVLEALGIRLKPEQDMQSCPMGDEAVAACGDG